MAYGSGYSSCTVNFVNPQTTPGGVSIITPTITAIEENGTRKTFDIYHHFLKAFSKSERDRMKNNLVNLFPTDITSSDANVSMKSGSKTLTISNDAVSSYQPIVIVLANPLFRDTYIPYFAELLTTKHIPMTQEITDTAAVTGINFIAESVTTEDFLKTFKNAFQASSFTPNSLSPSISSYSDFYDTSYGSEGFRFDLDTGTCVQNVDFENDNNESFGWRFVDGRAAFNWSMIRQNYGLKKNRDTADYVRIPCSVNGAVLLVGYPDLYNRQYLWKYHYSKVTERIEIDYYNMQYLEDDFREDNYGYLLRHNSTMPASVDKIAQLDLSVRSYFFINGKKLEPDTANFFRQGARMQSATPVSDTEVRYRTTKLFTNGTYTFSVQPAGRKGNKTFQPGRAIISNEGDILRQNGSATIS